MPFFPRQADAGSTRAAPALNRAARLAAWLLIALLAVGGDSHALATETVAFPGKAFPLSPLKQRIARQKGLPGTVAEAARLRGELYHPDGDGPHPALLLVHDCRGVRDYQRQRARQLAADGYLVMILDAFTSRGIEHTCQGLAEEENFRIRGGRVQDVFAAWDYLAARDDVLAFRIGLLGWDYHVVLGAVARDGIGKLFDARFMAAVAIHPGCNATSGTDFVAPVLVVIGEDDDYTPADECRVMERHATRSPEFFSVLYLDGAAHGFDDPQMAGTRHFPDYRNYFKSPARGVTMRYDEDATRRAWRRIDEFLDFQVARRPIPLTLDDLPRLHDAASYADATDVAAIAAGQQVLPSRGASVFDRVFSREEDGRRVYHVPFPFDELVAYLRQRAGGDAAGPIRAVLIPQGRSLVRDAARPHYFRHPRIVLAVDGEPAVADGRHGLDLRDRLFIAYQEQAQALEVISYNDAAGRFEFQVVNDYAPGRTADVRYADRALCVSCHQNHAPIFPNAPWDETNFNHQVFSRIRAERNDFYGLVPAVPVASSANALDRAANRARFAPVLDAIWREGCGSPVNGADAMRCRAAMVRAMLRYRLAASTGLDRGDPRLNTEYFHHAARAWQQRWPNGIAVMPANIPDRNPFSERMEVATRFDPLTPRGPEHLWSGERSGDLERVLTLLAGRFHRADIEALDAVLRTLPAGQPATRYAGDCVVTRQRRSPNRYLGDLACRDRQHTEQNDVAVLGTIDIDLANATVSGRLASLRRGKEFILFDLVFDPAVLGPGPAREARFGVRHRRSPLAVRAPSGDDAVDFTLRFHADDLDALPDRFALQLGFDIVPRFFHLDRHLDRLLENAIAGTTGSEPPPGDRLFGADRFHGNAVVAPLLSLLGVTEPLRDCCRGSPGPDEPRAVAGDLPATVDLAKAPAEDVLLAVCGRCHRGSEPFPPPFLAGDREQRLRAVRACGERIAYRVNMWTQAEDARRKSPMPPVRSLAGHDTFGTDAWLGSGAIDRISAHVLADSPWPGDLAAQLAQVLALPYGRLADCMDPTH